MKTAHEILEKYTSYENDEPWWTTQDILEAMEEYHQQFAEVSIKWSEGDFLHMIEESENPEIYDRSKVPSALRKMIKNHDATVGITWDTIEYYLNEYCKV